MDKNSTLPWVVFWTNRPEWYDPDNPCTDDLFSDEYTIVYSEKEAIETYKEISAKWTTHCAGWARITEATDWF